MWVILGTQGESTGREEKSDRAKAPAEERQPAVSRETREVEITQNCGSNEPIRGASGRRVIEPGNAVGWPLDQPVNVAKVGSCGAARATGSFPWVKPGWEMRECSDAGNSFKQIWLLVERKGSLWTGSQGGNCLRWGRKQEAADLWGEQQGMGE